MQWSSCKFLRGLVFSFLLLAPFAPELAAQSAETQATPPTIGNAAVTPAHVPAGETPTSALRLEAGDLVEVGVYNVPELTTKARVSSKGEIYLPLIDYVHVGDLTVDEAQALIQKRLEDGGFVRSAHVTIFVDESASQGVTILGEIAKPGLYPALGDRKLYDMISVAGGFTPSAGRKVSIIREHTEGGSITVNLPRNLADDLQDNVEIRPGDTISVPKAPIIYVVGDVNHPSGFMIDDNELTVLKALALAGGSTRTSALNRTKILRQTPSGLQEIPVDLKKVLFAKAPDMALVKGDVLFIPGSAAKAAAYRSADAAVSLSTALAVVAVH